MVLSCLFRITRYTYYFISHFASPGIGKDQQKPGILIFMEILFANQNSVLQLPNQLHEHRLLSLQIYILIFKTSEFCYLSNNKWPWTLMMCISIQNPIKFIYWDHYLICEENVLWVFSFIIELQFYLFKGVIVFFCPSESLNPSIWVSTILLDKTPGFFCVKCTS